MNWFKFYGQDFLTDMKISQLCVSERLMWVTLLCLAHSEGKGGNISYCTESTLKVKMGLQESDREWKDLDGFFKLFEDLGMITKTQNGIFIKNFEKRQEMQFTPAEKQARYRDKKNKVTNVTESKVTNVTLDKTRQDKNRIEKNNTTSVVNFEKQIDDIIDWAYDRAYTKPAISEAQYKESVRRAITKFGWPAVHAAYANEENAIAFLTHIKNL